MYFLFDHSSIVPLDRSPFSLFGIEVYWYGIFIVFGALLAFWVGVKGAKRFGITESVALDGFLGGLIVGVLGARLWYVAFEWSKYSDDLLSIITGFRDGGLAIHGAVFAAAIFAIIFCKVKKINPLLAGEFVAPGFLIGQISGRWGNFFNQEAHGGLIPGWPNLDLQRAWMEARLIPRFIIDQMYLTNIIPGVQDEIGYYHPTFLYESLWNLIGLMIIFALRKFCKKYWVGDSIIFYFIWYSIGRFFIEGMRTDSLMVGGLRTAQITSIIMFVAGIVAFVIRRIIKYYPASYRNPGEMLA